MTVPLTLYTASGPGLESAEMLAFVPASSKVALLPTEKLVKPGRGLTPDRSHAFLEPQTPTGDVELSKSVKVKPRVPGKGCRRSLSERRRERPRVGVTLRLFGLLGDHT